MSIIIAYLKRIGWADRVGPVWIGAAVAAAISTLLYITIYLTAARLQGPALEAFEGAAMIVAVLVLTTVIIWMCRHAAGISRQIQSQVGLSMGSPRTLAGLGFIAVIREGVELAIFLQAGTQTALSPFSFWLGSLAGSVAAILLGYLVYRGTVRLPVGGFFRVTGGVLILLAGGLLANGLAKFQEVGVVSPIREQVWNTSWLFSADSFVGQALHTLIGYDPAPSLTQAAAFFGYLLIAYPLFFRRSKAVGAIAPSPSQQA